ncbi:MAG TPA: hypothetical protein VEW93_01545 [Acidimicrobiales bacterium]|nr:hypothetical protein [Acidimicrobiales bacterium]
MPERLYVGTRKGLVVVDRHRDTWEPVDLHLPSVPVTAVLVGADGQLTVGADHGHYGPKLHQSTDGGTTWHDLAVPAYPAPEEVELDPVRREEVPWATSLLWALAAGDPDDPGVLWCGTMPGGLFRSTDGGASWELNLPLWDQPSRPEWFGGGYDHPAIHSVVPDPRGPERLVVGVSCGGAWRTVDGGASWEPGRGMAARYMPPDRIDDPTIQDPHRIVRCPAAPDVLWTQHHSGIFRSTDDGVTWTEVTEAGPSTFGFAVAVHPTDPDTAWFVPAVADDQRIPVDGRFVVTRTRDGGASFDVLSDGLPPAPAYDLVYRHALEVAPDGDRLAMGSTTGSLWTSDDQGDSWALTSAHLPPVNVVAFAP